MPYTTLLATYNGFTGAPGYTKIKFMGTLNPTEANTAAANLRIFLAALSTSMPTGSSYTIGATYQSFSDERVLLSEGTLSTVPLAVNGSSAAAYAGGSGTVVFWVTGAIHAGKKVKGRTYLVPLTSGAFASDGTLSATARTNIQNAAQAFATSTPSPCVSSKITVGGVPSYATVVAVGASLPDRAAQLRSRRD